jgi:hypothetical protein
VALRKRACATTVGCPVAKYGCSVAVADRLLPRPNKCTVRWTAFFNEAGAAILRFVLRAKKLTPSEQVDASEREVKTGLRVLFNAYLDAAGQLMLLDAGARRGAIEELERKMRSAEVEARTEAEEAPASDVRGL